VSKAPLKDIINNSDTIGRVEKWGIELAAFDIDYKPRTAIKSQALAEFMVDWKEVQETTPVPEREHWVMNLDGSKLLHGSGARVTLKYPKGDELRYVLQIHFPTTKNTAEYEALLHGLRVAKEISVQYIMCCGDSDLVTQQVAGIYKARNKVMVVYRDEMDEMAKSFIGYDIKHIQREDNMAAGTLSKLGSSRKAVPPGVFLEHLHIPSVKMVDLENPELASSPVMAVFPTNPPWAEPYLEYLTNKKLPEDEVQRRQIERRAKAYTIIDGQLYKRSNSGVFMKCISQVDGIEILREIHEGECGHHTTARSLVAKAIRHGFYWPTAKIDAAKLWSSAKAAGCIQRKFTCPPQHCIRSL
jgi:ribonuclease HI